MHRDRRSAPARVRVPVALALAAGLLGLAASASSAQPATATASPVVVAAAAPSPGHESQFVSRINSLRASKGLSQLQVHGELVGVARSWTERMVQAGQISHNPNLGSQVSADWSKLGENVGVGSDVDGLMQAFINSPSHYSNLVDPVWTHVGVGVTIAPDGRMYTTHNFMALRSSTPAPPPTTTAPPRRAAPASPAAAPSPAPAAPAPAPAAPPPEPHPTAERVAAVLDPLRSLEQG